MLTTEQKVFCAISHLGIFVGLPILAPLVVLLLSNDSFVKQQAKEALAFQIGMIIIAAIGGVLIFVLIGIPIVIAVALATVILPVIATIKIADSVDYSYPITGNFVRSRF